MKKMTEESINKEIHTRFKNMKLSDISPEEIIYHEMINKYIVDSVFTHYDDTKREEQEDQDVFTLRILKYRHWTLDYLLTKFLRRKSSEWDMFEHTFTNHKFKLLGGILNIAVKKNVSKDTNILYFTSANEILELQNLGLTSSQALTALIIEKLGCYNLLVEERKIKSNIVTNKTVLKQTIVAKAQKHLRLLQPIERLISNHHLTPSNYISKIKQTLFDYITQLEIEQRVLSQLTEWRKNKTASPKKIPLHFLCLDENTLKEYLKYDTQYLENSLTKINSSIEYGKQFREKLTKLPENIQDINVSLQTFLRYQTNEVIRNATAENDQITANSDDSLFRGKLRDLLVEADKITNNYVFDQLNPITKEHQSDFRKDEHGQDFSHSKEFGNNKILYRSRFHAGHGKKDHERLLIGLVALEERKKVAKSTLQAQKDNEVKVVKSASWNNFSTHTKKQKIRRFFAWSLTTLFHTPLAAINILVATLTGLAPVAGWMNTIEKFIYKKFKIEESYANDFYKYSAKLGENNVYTSTIIGKMLNKVVKELTGVIVQSPKLIYEKVVLQFKYLVSDFKNGFWGRHFQTKQQKTPDIKEKKLLPEQVERLKVLMQAAAAIHDLPNSIFSNQTRYANSKQPLDPYSPHDILSAFTGGIEGFINFFKDNVFEKHPVTGFVAALVYILGGSAVITPAILSSIFTKMGFTAQHAANLVTMLQSVGKPIARGTTSQAIAAGFTLAKAMGGTLNIAAQGFDSALLELINEIRKDPLIFGVGLGIAYGFGHIVTDVVNIPGLTNYLQDDIGDVPALCKVMIGAKLGLISLETALPEDEEHQSILATFVSDVAKNLMIVLRIALSPITLCSQPWQDGFHQIHRGGAIVINSLNRLAVLFTQLVILPAKTFLETLSTVCINTAKVFDAVVSLFKPKPNHEIPTAGFILNAKDKMLKKGYEVGFFVRENVSRSLERTYGKSIKTLERELRTPQQTHSEILKSLNIPVELVLPELGNSNIQMNKAIFVNFESESYKSKAEMAPDEEKLTSSFVMRG